MNYQLKILLLLFYALISDGRPVDKYKEGDTYMKGDMTLSRKIAAILANRNSTKAGSSSAEGNGQTYIITWDQNRIPYTFDSEVPAGKKAMIESAMKDIMNAVPNCWKFVEKTDDDKHWVEYNTNMTPGSCSSMVGNVSVAGQTPQYTNFGADFCTSGPMVHELFHLLGFQHEFTRNDRDEYIEVYYDRIKEDDRNNFRLDKDGGYASDTYDVPYNFKSIMHYGLSIVGALKNPVMRNKKNKAALGYDLPDDKVGQAYYISQGDLQLLARKGGCPDPTIEFYPIAGANKTDIDGPTSENQSCRSTQCSKVKETCRAGEKTTYEKCRGKGRCGMYKTVCCKTRKPLQQE